MRALKGLSNGVLRKRFRCQTKCRAVPKHLARYTSGSSAGRHGHNPLVVHTMPSHLAIARCLTSVCDGSACGYGAGEQTDRAMEGHHPRPAEPGGITINKREYLEVLPGASEKRVDGGPSNA